MRSRAAKRTRSGWNASRFRWLTSTSRRDQAALVCEDDGLHAVAQGELGEDVGDVGLDGSLADVQGGGDFGVALSGSQRAEHFALAVGQAGQVVLDMPRHGRVGCVLLDYSA